MGKCCNFEYSGQRKPPGEGDIQASKSLKEVREKSGGYCHREEGATGRDSSKGSECKALRWELLAHPGQSREAVNEVSKG